MPNQTEFCRGLDDRCGDGAAERRRTRARRLESGTGLSVEIGSEGPVVALRAELDALAMDDVKECPTRSRNPGVAHACRHDVHTTVVLGAGLVLSQLAREELLPGRVRLLSEPGEERFPAGPSKR